MGKWSIIYRWFTYYIDIVIIYVSLPEDKQYIPLNPIKTPLKYPIKTPETIRNHGIKPWFKAGCQGYPAAALKLHYKDAELISISPLPTKGPLGQRMFNGPKMAKAGNWCGKMWKDGKNM